MKNRSLFIICLAGLLLAGTAFAAEPERKLQLAVVGSVSADAPAYNPYTYCRPAAVQALLFALADEPLPAARVAERLAGSETSLDDLLRLEILRRDGDRVFLNFPLFTEKDQQLISAAAEKYSRRLADRILAKKDDIHRLLATYTPADVPREKLLFILVGALSMDLGALDLLDEHGFIVHGPEKPGGNRYVLNAEEVTRFSLKGIYWGCHSSNIGNTTFMTFGDHHRLPRHAFPDLAWRLGTWSPDDQPEFYRSELRHVLRNQLAGLQRDIARILAALAHGPAGAARLAEVTGQAADEIGHSLALLEKLHYIRQADEQYHLQVPVFTPADQAMMDGIRQLVLDEVLAWTRAHYATIRAELKEISPIRHGVDYKETFNMLWHYFFGYTNRYLATAGFLYDTYQAPPERQGFLPAVIIAAE
ncbi:MAG: hypothetical protein JXQ27_02200 [Acidobacteria bacterium]|nr:hypothetical protein [Acidobacteriota bacterium]